MKKLLFILVLLAFSSAKAQTSSGWYGYPPERQVSALIGGLTGGVFYSVARSNMENEPKWKSMLVAVGGTTITSLAMYGMVGNHSMVERRQNFTASFLSGVSITLIFSLGI